MDATRPNTPAPKIKHRTVNATEIVIRFAEAYTAVPAAKVPTDIALETTRSAACEWLTPDTESITKNEY